MRRRGRVVRALAALACVAMAAAALATAPAAPAQAAPARADTPAALAAPAARSALARAAALAAPAARSALADVTPYPPTNPGTDLAVSMPVNANASDVTYLLQTVLPPLLGLPVGANLSQIVAAVEAQTTGSVPTGGSPTPPRAPTIPLSAATVTVTETSTTTSTVTASISASAIPANAAKTDLAGLVASIGGIVALIIQFAICVRIGVGIGNITTQQQRAGLGSTCLAIAYAAWVIIAFAINDLMVGASLKGGVWVGIMLYALTTALFGAVQTQLTAWILANTPIGLAALVSGLQSIFTSISGWFSGPPGAGEAAAEAAAEAGINLPAVNPAALAIAAGAAGLPVAEAAGAITDSALSGGPYCMDGGYGHSQPLRVDYIVAINTCNGNSNQGWQVWPNGNLTDDGLCLEIAGGSWWPGAKLQLFWCNGSTAQVWEQHSTILGGPLLYNRTRSLCADDPDFNTTSGTQLQDATCWANVAQQWILPEIPLSGTGSSPVATNYGTMTSGISGKCMDAYGANGSVAPGQIVAINTCNGNQAQNWTTWSDNTVTAGGQCLDTGGGTAVGTLVLLWQCNGAASQVWSQQANGSLLNNKSGLCLDDPGSTTTNGTRLQLYTCNGTAAQRWTLPGNTTPTAPPGAPAPPSGGTPPSVCDTYASAGTPCAAAYSSVRALFANYNGPLYQVRRASDGTMANIGLLSIGWYVNAAEQDSFCAGTTCTITKIYDQSGNGNDLTIFTAGGDVGAVANADPITIDGNKAYGVYTVPGTGYRDDSPTGMPSNGAPEGEYMVASGTHVGSACCFDFGNAENNAADDGNGAMDAVSLSTTCYFSPCTGSGPWVSADLENGLFQGGNGSNTANLGNSSAFVTAMTATNGQTTYQVQGANAQAGGLSTWWNGPLPNIGGYVPLRQQSAIILGTGGDNTRDNVGTWFEGVVTTGEPSLAADNAVQANIVAAGYAGNSGNPPSGGGSGGGVPSTAPITGEMPSAAGPAVVHTTGANGPGYSSVFTVDASNGDLQETYLSNIGNVWATHDLSALYGTPPVKAGTQPVALFHCGYTSVYTVDASNGDLQETYLSTIGNVWATQDMSAKFGTPPTAVTPTAVVHYSGASGCGWTSVYTVDASNGNLQETYLPNAGFPGDPWVTQDLSAKYGTPAALAGTSAVSIVHCGFTSVYTVDANHQLQETYLSAIGAPWGTQSLSAKYGTPLTTTTPTAVVHGQGVTAPSSCGWTSVYTVNASNGDLEESYLSDIGFPGDPWQTQDLSARYGTPPVLAGTSPVALLHMSWTSVYTVDQGSDQLQETYLPIAGFPGDPWSTQSLSARYGTPPTVSTPVVLLHPDASGNLDWTSVYTVDAVNAFQTDLQETYLSNVGFPGDPWVTQDLSVKYGTPAVLVTFSQ